jgi:glycosyltransferase involved in cell wall biosynthesis
LRILVLTSTFPRWAGDREPPFVFELCRRLAVAHEVLVIAPHCRGAAREERLAANLSVRRFRYAPEILESLAYEGGILEKLRRAPWRFILIPGFVLGELLAAMRAVQRERPDVVHAHWVVPQGVVALLAAAASRGKPPAVVCTSHGADLFALRGLLARHVKAWVARHSAALTVVSTAMTTAALRLGAQPDRVRVMPMGVDARERFAPPPTGTRTTHQLLFVGRLVRKKGVRDLPHILALVRKSMPAVQLTIVGAGPLEAELRAEARALGLDAYIVFAGPVPNAELAAYYARAAVSVVPSVVTPEGDQEGLGLVIAEALACECPVVASDLPAIRDLVDDGVTGMLARPGDPADFAERIVELLGDAQRAARLARQGRLRVLERFDWQSVGRRYEELLSAVAG